MTLGRNDHYWGPRAHLDQILIRLVPDSDAELDALRNDEVDLINPEPTADLVNTVRRLPGVRSQARPSLGWEHLTFNLDHPILAELAVRQAIATAIDTQQLVDRLLRPVDPSAQPLGNRIWLTGQPPYQDHSGGYGKGDTQAAKRLLERAGWTLGADGVYAKDGERLELRYCDLHQGGPTAQGPRGAAPGPAGRRRHPAEPVQHRPLTPCSSGSAMATSTSRTSSGSATRSRSPIARTSTGQAAAATSAGSPTPPLTPCSNKGSASWTRPGRPPSATRSTSSCGPSSP